MRNIKVWDPLVRIFHWSLVITFVVGYVTGEEESDLHILAGYAVLGLVAFRILWGFVGTRYARFSDFVYSPARVVGYLKSLGTSVPEHFTGHNPAGGYVVIAMLVVLSVVTVSGLKVYAIEEGKGPLAGQAIEMEFISSAHADDSDHEPYDREGRDYDAEEFWEEIHEASSNLMVLLIVLHIGGVLISSHLHKENLVKAMITGKKSVPDDHKPD